MLLRNWVVPTIRVQVPNIILTLIDIANSRLHVLLLEHTSKGLIRRWVEIVLSGYKIQPFMRAQLACLVEGALSSCIYNIQLQAEDSK